MAEAPSATPRAVELQAQHHVVERAKVVIAGLDE
jgi:hypothetical protein